MSDILKDLKNVDLSFLSKSEAKEFTLLLEELEKRERRETSASSFIDVFFLPFKAAFFHVFFKLFKQLYHSFLVFLKLHAIGIYM